MVKLEKSLNRHVVVQFNDGTSAIAALTQTPGHDFPTPTLVKANTCNEFTENLGCSITVTSVSDYLAFRWLVHPTRKGKILRQLGTSNYSPYKMDMNLSSEDIAKFPINDPRIKKMKLKCDDYRWLPGGTKTQAPETLVPLSWVNQSQGRNSESQVTENSLGGSYAGVRFKRDDQNELVLESISYVSQTYGFMPPLDSGGFQIAQVLTLRNTDNQVCQITLAAGPNAYEFPNNNNNDDTISVHDPDKYEFYRYGSNKYIDVILGGQLEEGNLGQTLKYSGYIE